MGDVRITMAYKRNACSVLLGPEVKDSLEDLRLRCVINKWWTIFRMVIN
jgi:hypothetical protein